MILNNVVKVLVSIFLMGFVAACQQMPEEDVLDAETEESLNVQVRSAEGAEIVYPLYLYVFGKDGKLAVSQTIDNAEEDMALRVSEDDYQIIAMSGVSDAYQLPENMSLNAAISLGKGGAKTPLMMGEASISLSRNVSTKVELMMTHMVADLNVTLKNVPADVSEVQLTLSPLYSTLTMGGEYGGNSQKVEADCDETSNGVWKAGGIYIFPGSASKSSLSIRFKKKDGSEVTYGYTYKGVPEANKQFNVVGTYTADGVIVGGSFDVNEWEDAINVDFEFGGSEVPDVEDEEESDEPVIDLTGVPEIGTIWNDMIVVEMAETDDGKIDLLLMSLDEWDATTSQVDDVISGYSINGIAEWRLPDYEEAKLLRARFSGDNRLELNDLIAEYDEGLYGLDGEERYLCLKEGAYYSFKFAGGTTISKAGEKRSYYVRLVKSYRFEKN